METLSFSLLSAFTLGFLGSAHCFGMCGGIISALSLRHVPSDGALKFSTHLILLLCYNLGRITSYGLAGFTLGLLGFWLGDFSLIIQLLLRYFASFLLIAMGLYLAGWWRGLTYLERVGYYLWRYIQPLTGYCFPIKTPNRALMAGFLWGWLPCGLVYSTLFWSVSIGTNAAYSALLMIAFGLGTLPSMLATGLAANRIQSFISAMITRYLVGIMMILFGIWTAPPMAAQLMFIFG